MLIAMISLRDFYELRHNLWVTDSAGFCLGTDSVEHRIGTKDDFILYGTIRGLIYYMLRQRYSYCDDGILF